MMGRTIHFGGDASIQYNASRRAAAYISPDLPGRYAVNSRMFRASGKTLVDNAQIRCRSISDPPLPFPLWAEEQASLSATTHALGEDDARKMCTGTWEQEVWGLPPVNGKFGACPHAISERRWK
jgi:hypothetical protein